MAGDLPTKRHQDAQAAARESGSELEIRSDLQGVTMDLPLPYGKQAESVAPLDLQTSFGKAVSSLPAVLATIAFYLGLPVYESPGYARSAKRQSRPAGRQFAADRRYRVISTGLSRTQSSLFRHVGWAQSDSELDQTIAVAISGRMFSLSMGEEPPEWLFA